MKRIALVTGARHRVGHEICSVLLADGWRVYAHVREEGDEVADGAIAVACDLEVADAGEAVFEQIDEPVGLLVNNAALFEADSLRDVDADAFERQMRVNLRAPALLTQAFAERHLGGDALIVNILDNRLAAENPDFLSYALSKEGLAGLTRIAARALAVQGIRVNGIAPSVMLPSGDQSEAEFKKVHDLNPLGRGVTPDDLVDALLWLVGADKVTGQTVWLDGGQRFLALPRDVQFLENK